MMPEFSAARRWFWTHWKDKKPVRKHRTELLTLPFVCFGLLLAQGCGGGGHNVSSETSYPLAARLRSIQQGDTWDYRLSVQSGGQSFMGTANVFLSTTTVNGQSELAQTTTISSERQAYKAVMYYQQDATSSDLVWYGGPDYTLPPPVPSVPGVWAKGVSFTTQSTDQTGQQVTVSLQVIGTETVSVPLGRFQTWKVTASQNINGFENTTGTYWYAPQIGTYVKGVFNSASTGGQYAGDSYDYSLDLTSTSVPLNP